jgi:outer membrane immunogenic protein
MLHRKLVGVAAVAITAAMAIPASATGLRVEVHGGWDNLDSSVGNDDGFLYGGGIGYDLNLSRNIFLGIEGNLAESTMKECLTVGSTTTCAKAGLDFSTGGRVGLNVGRASKLYALGGYTRSKTRTVTTTPAAVSKASDWSDGWRIGAGYQHALRSGLYVKSEYRYSNYERGIDRHNLIAGLGYQF